MTLLGIEIEVREVQRRKPESPIEETLLGIVIEVREVHPLKADVPILVRP